MRTLVGGLPVKLVYWRNVGQSTQAIYVLACISPTRPVLRRPIRIIHYDKVVRFHARFVRDL